MSGDARPLSGGDDNPRGRDDIPWGGDGIPDGIGNMGLGDGGGGFRCDSRRGNRAGLGLWSRNRRRRLGVLARLFSWFLRHLGDRLLDRFDGELWLVL